MNSTRPRQGSPGLVGAAAVLLATAALLVGCATERPFIWARDVPAAVLAPEPEAPVVRPRDSILVHVQDQLALSGEYVVREDGAYFHPTLGNVAVEGKTPAQVTELLQGRLTGMVVNPRVTVSISRRAPIRVNVVGEVKTPGSYDLTRDRSVTAALAAAGWLTVFAASDRIFVVRSSEKDFRIRFKAQELTAPGTQATQFRLRDGDVVVVE